MKTLPAIIAFLSIAILLSGCGKDGNKGDAFISLDWDWYVDGYNDNNPSLPSTISKHFDYSTKPGVYNCEYLCSDGSGDEWYWEYTYTIKINSGQPGRLFRKGNDGKDRYHKLFLHGLSQPSFSFIEKGMKTPQKKVKKQLSRYESKTDQHTKIYHGEPLHETYYQNGYQISIEKRMFTLE